MGVKNEGPRRGLVSGANPTSLAGLRGAALRPDWLQSCTAALLSTSGDPRVRRLNGQPTQSGQGQSARRCSKVKMPVRVPIAEDGLHGVVADQLQADRVDVGGHAAGLEQGQHRSPRPRTRRSGN